MQSDTTTHHSRWLVRPAVVAPFKGLSDRLGIQSRLEFPIVLRRETLPLAHSPETSRIVEACGDTGIEYDEYAEDLAAADGVMTEIQAGAPTMSLAQIKADLGLLTCGDALTTVDCIGRLPNFLRTNRGLMLPPGRYKPRGSRAEIPAQSTRSTKGQHRRGSRSVRKVRGAFLRSNTRPRLCSLNSAGRLRYPRRWPQPRAQCHR
jgi:hypothetical protein